MKELQPINSINLLNSTVKVTQTERNHSLVLNAGDTQLIFQATGPDDMLEWKTIIEAGIALQIASKKPSSV